MENIKDLQTEFSYEKFKEREREEINNLPIYWAFTNRQWNELLIELGLTKENAKEHLCIYLGGIVFKKDIPMIRDILSRLAFMKEAYLENTTSFKEAVIYEMVNHEYAINWQGDYDVINALGFKTKYSDGNEIADSNMSEEQKKAYTEVKQEYLKKHGHSFF